MTRQEVIDKLRKLYTQLGTDMEAFPSGQTEDLMKTVRTAMERLEREQRLEDLLKRVLEENDHNVSTEGLISTLTCELATDIVQELT